MSACRSAVYNLEHSLFNACEALLLLFAPADLRSKVLNQHASCWWSSVHLGQRCNMETVRSSNFLSLFRSDADSLWLICCVLAMHFSKCLLCLLKSASDFFHCCLLSLFKPDKERSLSGILFLRFVSECSFRCILLIKSAAVLSYSAVCSISWRLPPYCLTSLFVPSHEDCCRIVSHRCFLLLTKTAAEWFPRYLLSIKFCFRMCSQMFSLSACLLWNIFSAVV